MKFQYFIRRKCVFITKPYFFSMQEISRSLVAVPVKTMTQTLPDLRPAILTTSLMSASIRRGRPWVSFWFIFFSISWGKDICHTDTELVICFQRLIFSAITPTPMHVMFTQCFKNKEKRKKREHETLAVVCCLLHFQHHFMPVNLMFNDCQVCYCIILPGISVDVLHSHVTQDIIISDVTVFVPLVSKISFCFLSYLASLLFN